MIIDPILMKRKLKGNEKKMERKGKGKEREGNKKEIKRKGKGKGKLKAIFHYETWQRSFQGDGKGDDGKT